jgi:cytochrome c5
MEDRNVERRSVVMKWMCGRAGAWLWVTALSVAAAFAAGQFQLPEGEGKTILETACTRCHTLESRLSDKHLPKSDWENIVQAMRDKGAQVTDAQVAVLNDYLVKNFGPAEADAAGSGPSEAEAKQLVESACTSCHGMDLITSQQRDKDGWKTVIQSMVDIGAELTPAQIEVVADYLAKTYGIN